MSGICGIDGQRLDFVNLVAAGRADLGPCCAAVAGPVDSLERSRKERVRIGGRLRQARESAGP